MNQISWTPGVSLETLIQQVVEAALTFYKGNKTATAQSLGIAIRTLDNRLEKYAKEKVQKDAKVYDARTARQEFIDRQRAVPGAARFDTSATPSVYAPSTNAPFGSQAGSGSRMESFANDSAKQSMPMQKREKV